MKKLKKLIIQNEPKIYEALLSDFNKPRFETFVSEIGVTILEVENAIKNLQEWTAPKHVNGNLLLFPSKSKIVPRPKGSVLIVAPWNYPFNLSLIPAIAAIAAGNTVIIKPSEEAPHISKLIANIINSNFESNFFHVIEGGIEEAKTLTSLPFDHIFFTGSPQVGKLVMAAAAPNLTTVTLELGGKNPCFIHQSAKIKQAARRIVWGKFLNAGQTCIAPDHLIVDENIKHDLIQALQEEIEKQYGQKVMDNPDFAKIVNQKHFLRLNAYLSDGNIVFGGESNLENKYIAPTLIEPHNLETTLMKEEIFGPILPIIGYKSEEEAIEIALKHPNPLSLYIFAKSKKFQEAIISRVPAGGVGVNDVVEHYANKELPFGGLRTSGMGAYHGKHGFDTFSHAQAIYKKATWIDIPLKYAPFKNKLPLIKRAFNITELLS